MYKALAKKRRDEGFTLVELLITIVIIGVLAAVVVLAIGGLTDTGSSSACGATRDAAQAASTAYYSQQTNPTWPSNFNQLIPTYMTARSGTSITSAQVVSGSGWTLTMGAGGAAEPTFLCANT